MNFFYIITGISGTIIIIIFITIVVIMHKKIFTLIKDFFQFIFAIFNTRYIIFQLTKRDFKKKYLGSFLGIIWAFIQPAVYIIVIWAVFSFGFKSGKIDKNIPFILWLVTGLIPWFFISESIISATNSFIEYSYLIKKVVFRASIIPIIKILSVLIIHIFLTITIIIFCIFNKFYPKIIWIQYFYYLFSIVIFIIGLSWLTSSLTVFIKDIGQIVNLIIQIMFWGTPIFWNPDLLPDKIKFILFLNPFHYIIQGYRNTFIYKIYFWENPFYLISFWICTITVFIIGALVFKKLRPHFADVI